MRLVAQLTTHHVEERQFQPRRLAIGRAKLDDRIATVSHIGNALVPAVGPLLRAIRAEFYEDRIATESILVYVTADLEGQSENRGGLVC